MTAAAEKGGGKSAGQRLEQRVRAGIVAARGQIDVVRAQQVGERRRGERSYDTDPPEARLGTAGECDLVRIEVEVPVDPAENVGALARVVRPAGRDDTHATARERVARGGRMKDRRVDGVRDHHRVAKLEPDLAMLVQAVLRLDDGRVRKLAVDGDDPAVGAVVEP